MIKKRIKYFRQFDYNNSLLIKTTRQLMLKGEQFGTAAVHPVYTQ